jgi:hypothetical protein
MDPETRRYFFWRWITHAHYFPSDVHRITLKYSEKVLALQYSLETAYAAGPVCPHESAWRRHHMDQICVTSSYSKDLI